MRMGASKEKCCNSLANNLKLPLLDKEPHTTMFHYYQTLIELRKYHPVLQHLNRTQLDVQVSEQKKTLLLRRWHENEHLHCLMNFSKEPQQIILSLDENNRIKLLNFADPIWKGTLAADEVVSDEAAIILQPESVLIYSNQAS